MKTARQSWVWAGSFSLAVLTTVGAVAQDPTTDEPAVQAEKPVDDPAIAADLQPVPDPAFGGLPPAANVVVPGMVVPAPSIGVAAPSVVGDYRVGHVHRSPLSRIFWYSAYNPYIDQLHAPIRARVFNNAHAPYYAGYRTIHTSNWSTYYVPQTQCYAPNVYGYTTSPPPIEANAANGSQSVNGPTVYAPYGAGSATYFGYYGPAGY